MARILDALISLAVFVTWIVVGIVITLVVLLPFSSILLGIFTFWGWSWFFAIPFIINIILLIILLMSMDDNVIEGGVCYVLWTIVVVFLSFLCLSVNLG